MSRGKCATLFVYTEDIFPLDISPLPCSIRVRVRSRVSKVRISRVSISIGVIRVMVRFMVWFRGKCHGGEMSRWECPTFVVYNTTKTVKDC